MDRRNLYSLRSMQAVLPGACHRILWRQNADCAGAVQWLRKMCEGLLHAGNLERRAGADPRAAVYVKEEYIQNEEVQ